MREELIVRVVKCFDEFYGVDGDGLGEGEVTSEADFELLSLKLAQNPSHKERHGRVWGDQL
jgi:hypothetical protein